MSVFSTGQHISILVQQSRLRDFSYIRCSWLWYPPHESNAHPDETSLSHHDHMDKHGQNLQWNALTFPNVNIFNFLVFSEPTPSDDSSGTPSHFIRLCSGPDVFQGFSNLGCSLILWIYTLHENQNLLYQWSFRTVCRVYFCIYWWMHWSCQHQEGVTERAMVLSCTDIAMFLQTQPAAMVHLVVGRSLHIQQVVFLFRSQSPQQGSDKCYLFLRQSKLPSPSLLFRAYINGKSLVQTYPHLLVLRARTRHLLLSLAKVLKLNAIMAKIIFYSYVI